MRNLPFEFIARKNRLYNPNAWVWLFQIQADGDDTFLLTNNDICVEFDGFEYDPYDIDFDGLSASINGDELETSLRVSNVNQQLAAFLDLTEGLMDNTVTILLTNLEDPFSEAYEETYKVIDSSASNREIVLQLSLLAISEQEFPGLFYIKDFCRWEFGSTQCDFDLGLLNPGETCTKRKEGAFGCDFWGAREEANAQTRKHPQRFGAFPGLTHGIAFEV